MSVRCITWVWDHSEAKGVDRLVLLALADNADDKGQCWPSVAELARKARVSARTVQRSLRDLEAAGEVVTARGGTAGRGSNRYRINLDPRVQSIPAPPVNLSPRQPDTGCQPDGGDNVSSPIGGELDNNRGVILSPVTTVSPEPSRTTNKKETPRPEVAALCEHLADRIEGNGSKRPSVTRQWLDACRLMIDVDGREPEKIRRCIDWCQDDEFWRGNILSMPKLRQQYDRLRLAVQTRPKAGAARPVDRIAAGRAAGIPEAWQ